MAPLTLLSLPSEILLLLPAHLHNIEDFTNLSSTCHRLHTVLADTLPKQLLQLATNSAPTFFSPHPSHLVLCVARQLAHWTTASPADLTSRTTLLTSALQSGLPGLLSLALSPSTPGVGLPLPALRAMHLARFSVINPLTATLDAMVGRAWYAQPDFWSAASDAFTLYADASDLTYQLLIYAELFAPSMEQFLRPKAERGPVLGPEVRIEFVKYCVPDWVCRPGEGRGDGFRVEATGPYGEGWEGEVRGAQTAMAHLLGGAMFRGTLWKRAWRRVFGEVGAEGEDGDGGGWPEEWVAEMKKVEWKVEREVEVVEDDGADVDEGSCLEEVQDGEGETDDEDFFGAVGEEEEGDDGAPVTVTIPVPDPSDLPPIIPWRYTLFVNALTTTCIFPSLPLPFASSSPPLPLANFAPVARFKGREHGRPLTLSPEEKRYIIALRDKVLALGDDDEPGYFEVGRRRTLRISEAPDLKREAYWCCAGLWTGL